MTTKHFAKWTASGFLLSLILGLLISRGSGVLVLLTLGTALGALLGVLAKDASPAEPEVNLGLNPP